jgi:hypothetical protein
MAQFLKQVRLPRKVASSMCWCIALAQLGQAHEYDYDVPPYKDPKYVNDPEGGAEKHWAETMKKIPPEFDKERTWLEPINEVDKDFV